MPSDPSADASGPTAPANAVRAHDDAPSTRQEELRSFVFFTVVMAPVLAVLLVATYGFIVWMWQLVAGPPGT